MQSSCVSLLSLEKILPSKLLSCRIFLEIQVAHREASFNTEEAEMPELLTRRDAAEYLETKGVRSSKSTLARYAMGGDGPQYTLIGRTAYYKPEWLDQWLEAQMEPHSHSLAHAMAKVGEEL